MDGQRTIRRHVVVSGRVQAVGFRAACEREATRLGVTGWVRNRADGAVEAVFEGPEAAVGAMVAWSGHGPRHAQVTDVTARPEDPEGLRAFRVSG